MADQLEEAAAGMIVLGVQPEMSRQVLDPLRQERDLDLGGPRVPFAHREFGDDPVLGFPHERHSVLRHENFYNTF